MSPRLLVLTVATLVVVLGAGAGAAMAQQPWDTLPPPPVVLGDDDDDDDDELEDEDDDDGEGRRVRGGTPPPPAAPPPPVSPPPASPAPAVPAPTVTVLAPVAPAGPAAPTTTTPARPRSPLAARRLIGDHLLRPSTGRMLGGLRPTYRWRGGPAGVRLYNVQVFTADRRKVLTAFSPGRALRPRADLAPGRTYVWRVWPWVRGRGYTARPLGLSWFATPTRAAMAAARG